MPNGDCILEQMKLEKAVLMVPHKTNKQKLVTFKFFVHFMGDLHMPLHCADDGDRGGNDKLVRFKTPGRFGRGTKIKLHALWDCLIEIKPEDDPREMATGIERNITDDEKATWTKGEVQDWALESYLIAKTVIYEGMSPSRQDYTDNLLPINYYNQMRPIVDVQLEKAGIRLAHVLNEIFK